MPSVEKNCITIQRSVFAKQVWEVIQDMDEDDFTKKLKVTFVGEEGVDEGGPTRKFFTLFFSDTAMVESGMFKRDQNMIDEKKIELYGKMTAYAVLHGHPGPRNLNMVIGNYIIFGNEPDASTKIDLDNLNDASRKTAIMDVCIF